MPKAHLPHSTAEVLDGSNRFTIAWSNFFEQLKNRVGAVKNYSLGGLLINNITAVGNITSGADTLISESLEKNTLLNAGDSIEIVSCGTTAANGNNKTIDLVVGTTTLFTTGALAFNDKDWCLSCVLTRLTATTFQAITTFSGDISLLTATANFVSGTENFATKLAIKTVGTSGGSATNDIINKGLFVKLFPI